MNLRRMRTAMALGTICFFVTACGTFGGRTDAPKAAAEIRDLPMKARGQIDEPRRRVMVLPVLDNEMTRATTIADNTRKALVRSLIRSDAFVVVENQDFPKDLSAFKKSAGYDLPEISRTAQQMGVAAIIEARILDIKAQKLGDQVGLIRSVKVKVQATIQVRVMSTRHMKEILNETRSSELETVARQVGTYSASNQGLLEDPDLIRDVVGKAFRDVLPTISAAVRKLGWEGKIAMIRGERIYINAGRISGIQLGDLLRVREEGDSVFDPESGDLIGKAPGRMKGTLEVVTYFGQDGCIGVIHSGAGFKEADFVELY